ncbi:Hypothetical predicted protein, partial [Paramuricea clavata]
MESLAKFKESSSAGKGTNSGKIAPPRSESKDKSSDALSEPRSDSLQWEEETAPQGDLSLRQSFLDMGEVDFRLGDRHRLVPAKDGLTGRSSTTASIDGSFDSIWQMLNQHLAYLHPREATWQKCKHRQYIYIANLSGVGSSCLSLFAWWQCYKEPKPSKSSQEASFQ